MRRTRAQPCVLHIDDSEVSRYAVARVLQTAGYSAREARSGQEGLALATTLRPDVIILDVDLPDLSGLEVCQRIRADPTIGGTPVLHLSGARTASDDRAAGLETGADAYLTQPVDPRELLATVRALIRVRRAEEESRRLVRTLRRSVRAREEALAAVWREVGEPLSGIEIAAAGLRGRVPDGDVVCRERLGTVVAGAARIRTALGELLELARLEGGRAPLAVADHGVRELVDDLQRRLARAAGPGVVLEAPPHPALAVRCDRERVLQALVSIASGAAASGVSELALRVADEGAQVRLSFAPFAPRAPRRWGAAALRPYWQAGAAGRRDADAGMALARAVFEAHDGRAWLEGGKDAGVALHLTLPSARPRQAQGG